MMDMLIVLALGAVKGLVLLAVAAAVGGLLRRQSARLRAVVWATALAGSVMVPLAAPFIPALPLPLPFEFEPVEPAATHTVDGNRVLPQSWHQVSEVGVGAGGLREIVETRTERERRWPMVLVVVWAAGVVLVFGRYGLDLLRMAQTTRRARPVRDRRWLALADHCAARIGLKRPFRMLVSDQIEMPATAGFFRPVVIIPEHSEQWLTERREAVLLHELIHIARFDWPARIVARFALALYWVNPLAWWAVRRLELEQELACDEELLATGTRASSYANHLLGIARGACNGPVPAVVGLQMAKRNQLEERIMTMLSRSTHRKTRLAVLLPTAFLVAAMVPALAAVYPTEATPSSSGKELKEIMDQMQATEARLEPFLERIEAFKINIEPQLEMIDEINIEINEEAIAEIELRMEPYLERISEISIEMAPLREQIEAMSEQIAEVRLHIEDGTLEEIEQQVHEQVEKHMESMEDLHIEFEPFLAELEVVHEEMEHLHLEMEQVHVIAEPSREALERIHESLEPLHEQVEGIHLEMEPIHEEMERLGARIEEILRGDVEQVLRNHLESTVAPMAPFEEAAARVMAEAHSHVDDDLVEIDANRKETRLVLSDLFTSHRIGTEGTFEDAVDAASRALSPLKIVVE